MRLNPAKIRRSSDETPYFQLQAEIMNDLTVGNSPLEWINTAEKEQEEREGRSWLYATALQDPFALESLPLPCRTRVCWSLVRIAATEEIQRAEATTHEPDLRKRRTLIPRTQRGPVNSARAIPESVEMHGARRTLRLCPSISR